MSSINFQNGTIIPASWLNDVNDAVYTKVANYVTPEQYGAVGDNTTNDHTALQNAFNSGKPVYITKQYYTATPLSVPSGLTLFGAGPSSMIRGSGSEPVIEGIGTAGTHLSNITIQNLTLKRSSGTYATSQQPFIFAYVDDVIVQNVTFDGDYPNSSYPGSLMFQSATRLTVDTCNFINGASLSVTSFGASASTAFSEYVTIRNCYKAAAPTQGFNLYYVKYVVIDGCYAYGSTSTYGCGFVIEGSASYLTITNCVSVGNTRSGYYFEPWSAYSIYGITIDNCIASQNGETGIYMQNVVSATITGGAMRDTYSSFGGDYGAIALHTCADVNVTGVQLVSNQGFGIYFDGGQNLNATGCLFQNINGPGIKIGTTNATQSVTLSSNSFRDVLSTVANWVESSTGLWDDGPWKVYTPTVYDNTGTAVVTTSNLYCKYKRIGQVCHIEAYFEFSASASLSTMYVSIPFTGGWPVSSTGPEASMMRGTAYGNVVKTVYMDGRYFNDRLCVVGLGATDTNVRFTATFEIA